MTQIQEEGVAFLCLCLITCTSSPFVTTRDREGDLSNIWTFWRCLRCNQDEGFIVYRKHSQNHYCRNLNLRGRVLWPQRWSVIPGYYVQFIKRLDDNDVQWVGRVVRMVIMAVMEGWVVRMIYILWCSVCVFVTKNHHFPLPSWAQKARSEPPARPCQPLAGFGLVMMMMTMMMMVGRVVRPGFNKSGWSGGLRPGRPDDGGTSTDYIRSRWSSSWWGW